MKLHNRILTEGMKMYQIVTHHLFLNLKALHSLSFVLKVVVIENIIDMMKYAKSLLMMIDRFK